MAQAHDFSLLDQTGTLRTLNDFAGKWLVLYFYPKDNTPGCTTEACGFRDANEALLAKNAAVVGVSKDSVQSHQKFIAQYKLPFTLLSDPDHVTIEQYGAWGGLGTQRKTVIVNPDGEIVKEYPKVTPAEHATQILQDLVQLQGAQA